MCIFKCIFKHCILRKIRGTFLSLSEEKKATLAGLKRLCCLRRPLAYSLLNNPTDLDPSYKMDLYFWDCFGRKKNCLITEEIQYIVRKPELRCMDTHSGEKFLSFKSTLHFRRVTSSRQAKKRSQKFHHFATRHKNHHP